MDELFSSVDSLSGVTTTDRVNPADRSNKDKKKNAFSDVLKKKLKEQQKEKDLLILQHDESDDEIEEEKEDKQHEKQDESTNRNETPDDSIAEHVDVKA